MTFPKQTPEQRRMAAFAYYCSLVESFRDLARLTTQDTERYRFIQAVRFWAGRARAVYTGEIR